MYVIASISAIVKRWQAHMKEEPYPMQVPPLAHGSDAQMSSWHWKTFLPVLLLPPKFAVFPVTLAMSGTMADCKMITNYRESLIGNPKLSSNSYLLCYSLVSRYICWGLHHYHQGILNIIHRFIITDSKNGDLCRDRRNRVREQPSSKASCTSS